MGNLEFGLRYAVLVCTGILHPFGRCSLCTGQMEYTVIQNLGLAHIRKIQHGSMCCKHTHTVTSWRHGNPQYNCVFVNSDELLTPGMLGLNVA